MIRVLGSPCRARPHPGVYQLPSVRVLLCRGWPLPARLYDNRNNSETGGHIPVRRANQHRWPPNFSRSRSRRVAIPAA